MQEYLDNTGNKIGRKIDFRIPDYPDSRRVEQIYNDIVEI